MGGDMSQDPIDRLVPTRDLQDLQAGIEKTPAPPGRGSVTS